MFDPRSDGVFPLSAVLVFIGLNALVGLGGAASAAVATAHGVVVVLFAIGYLFFGKRLDRIVAVSAYAAMCDVYWRMTRSSMPWEFSKYLLALGAVVILARFAKRWRKPAVPVAFLLCLVPGMLMAVAYVGPVAARGQISGDEMGVISLGLAALAFRQVVASRNDMWNLGWIMLGPIAAVAMVVTHATLTAKDLEFGEESNFAATGGYGPNQVAALLGLGAMLCGLLAYQRHKARSTPVLIGLGLWCAWASFVTFSRGGIYSLVVAAAAMALVGVGSRGVRGRALTWVVVAAVGITFVFSGANELSGNELDQRFEDKNTSHRTELAEEEWEMFLDHPILGVGTGQIHEYRDKSTLGVAAAAHTEFTRLLAEHGMFGLVALILMGVMLVQGFSDSMCRWNRLLVVGGGAWALVTMTHAATRIAAVGLMFALTQLRVEDPTPHRR